MKQTKSLVTFGLLAVCALCAALFLQPDAAKQASADTTPTATPIPDPNDFTTQGPFGFGPFTIADFGPVTTNAAVPGSLAVSGDWVAYTSSHIVCGHCGYYADTLYIQNVVTGQLISIKGSSQMLGDSKVGITDVAIRNTAVRWTQPADPATLPSPTPGLGAFIPGDYTCDKCYYDVETGKGGQVVGDRQPPVIPPAWSVETSPYDPNNTAEQTITVTQQPTGTLAFRATFHNYWQTGGFAFDSNKMVYIQNQVGYGTPQLVRVAWLLPTDPAFTEVWNKADAPVAAGKVARSWLWGPAPILTRYEQYAQGQGQQRLVQYYDKSRMEINNPNANPQSPGYTTNGLLAVEMISGELQTGDIERVSTTIPCTIPVAGDPRQYNPLTPGYADLLSVATIHGENQAEERTGQPVDDAIDVHGNVSKLPIMTMPVSYAAYADATKHNIPDVFWTYLTGMNDTYGFDWTYVLGYPITEAYWTQMRVGGVDMPVLVQAYQRRVLTYTPGFDPTWQVEQGNVGQHYLEWLTLNRVNSLANPDILP